jgi:hypothetical protein
MEFSPAAMTKCLVTGEIADQTHSKQGQEVLSKQTLRQTYVSAPLPLPQTLATPTPHPVREAGWMAFVPICNHKACICFYDAG